MPPLIVRFARGRHASWTKKLKMSSVMRTHGSACAWMNCVGYVAASAGSNGRSVEKVNDPSRYRGKNVGAWMMLTSAPALKSCVDREYEKLLIICQRFSSRP